MARHSSRPYRPSVPRQSPGSTHRLARRWLAPWVVAAALAPGGIGGVWAIMRGGGSDSESSAAQAATDKMVLTKPSQPAERPPVQAVQAQTAAPKPVETGPPPAIVPGSVKTTAETLPQQDGWDT